MHLDQSHEQTQVPQSRGVMVQAEDDIFSPARLVLVPVSKPLSGVGDLGGEISKDE